MTSRSARRHAAAPPAPGGGLLTSAGLAVLLVVGGIGGAAVAGRSLPVSWPWAGSGSGPAQPVVGSPVVDAAGAASPSGAGPAGAVTTATTSTTAGGTTEAAGASSAATGTAADAAGLTADDRVAGLLAATVPQRGTGRLAVVPGSTTAPGTGPVTRVRVEVEGGLDVDGATFASFVLGVLNDSRSWGHGGRKTFARTSGAADVRVVLASPQTSARLCAPLQTMGTLSCGVGNTAVLTLYRWVKAIPDYGTDRAGYRRYVVNHEVGHTLGHGHELCPGSGRVAPVMMQQTKGLKGCRPNSWPFP